MNKPIAHTTKPWLSWQEALFFLIYFAVMPSLSALQYASDFNEKDSLLVTIIYFGVAGFFNIPAFIFYYKFIVPRFLFTRRYGWFIITLLIFIAVFDFYIRFANDWLISKMSFLPDEVTRMAANAFKRQRNGPRQSIYLTLMHLLAVTAVAYFVRMRQKDREIQQLREQQLQLELDALKAQMHPHFFFNTLNNIYSLALQQSSQTAPVVQKLASLMRYILYETSQAHVPLNKEIGFIRDYIELENIRHDTNKQINFLFQGNATAYQVPPLLLLPFVENAFKHGLDQETGNGRIDIAILIEKDQLNLQVSNSLPADITTDATGVGLQNVRKRLELLFPNAHQLDIEKKEDEFRILLNLQLS
ncbi:MAG: histidine kinase [Chitinophagaceae bacterium]